MTKIKFEYFCDICKKKINMSNHESAVGSIHIEDTELTTEWDEGGKSGTSWYKQWDLCKDCYEKKFNREYKKALKYFKNKEEENDG